MIGKSTFEKLQAIGITHIHALRKLSPESAHQLLGKYGTHIWEKANGIDTSPVRPYHEQKSISKERTFNKDITNTNLIHNLLSGMIEQLAFQLRKQQKLSGLVSIKIRYSNFETYNLQKSISYTSLDHVFIQTASELFTHLYQEGRPIRLIGVKIGQLIRSHPQLNLFNNDTQQFELYKAMDKIRVKYGKYSIKRASGLKK